MENIKDEMVNKNTFVKEHLIFVGLLVKDIKISDIFYKIKKLPRNIMAAMITTIPIFNNTVWY